MTYAAPVIGLENVQLDAVRTGTRELGAVQVVNHGVRGELRAGGWRSGCSGCTRGPSGWVRRRSRWAPCRTTG